MYLRSYAVSTLRMSSAVSSMMYPVVLYHGIACISMGDIIA